MVQQDCKAEDDVFSSWVQITKQVVLTEDKGYGPQCVDHHRCNLLLHL